MNVFKGNISNGPSLMLSRWITALAIAAIAVIALVATNPNGFSQESEVDDSRPPESGEDPMAAILEKLPVEKEANLDKQTPDALAPQDESDRLKTDNAADPVRALQSDAVIRQQSQVVHWGRQKGKYVTWSQHSNRLVPIYTFGITLDSWRDRGSPYADPDRIADIYGSVPKRTYNPVATYHDQTDVYRLQQRAKEMGCTAIIMMIFDGMDWPTTRAAAVFANPDKSRQTHRTAYRSGRGSGLSIMDYRGCPTDFGLVVTSAFCGRATYDVNGQVVEPIPDPTNGGYDVVRGGERPWLENSDQEYLMGNDREVHHQVTDSASSATSIFSGIKTYNGSINFGPDGRKVVPIARDLQREGWKVGIVTSVPVSHATAAAAYANNVTRKDYQDIARDMIGLPSASHRNDPLPGVDVLIGGGWGKGSKRDKAQGDNALPGNQFIHHSDVESVTSSSSSNASSSSNTPNYVLATRTKGVAGRDSILNAAETAIQSNTRLLGLYGIESGHLPFRTADGKYDPTFDIKGGEKYSDADIFENPTLADMTEAALMVLEKSTRGFYLMVEAGDVDWANHANNLDNSIGAVISGDQAFDVVTRWVQRNKAWDRTAVIVTADHGHFLVVDDDVALAHAGERTAKNAAQNSAAKDNTARDKAARNKAARDKADNGKADNETASKKISAKNTAKDH